MTHPLSRPPRTSQTWGRFFRGRDDWWLLLAVLLLVLADSAWRWPVPAANEPHYLTMARHQWDPEWCRRDLFFQSTPAHTVFYRTIGLLTVGLTLEHAAWLGRVLAFALFSWGWIRLGRRLLPDRTAVLWATVIYLILAAEGSFSGEWIIRGCEAKVFSYGLFFLAMSSALSRNWISAAWGWGLSTSMHPLVGIWSLICYAVAELTFFAKKLMGGASAARAIVDSEQPPARKGVVWLKAVVVLIIAALPGLLTLLPLFQGVDPKLQYQATYIQVFYRLAHHLDPMTFPATAYRFAGILIAVWLCGSRWGTATRSRVCFSRFVGLTIVLAAIGVVIG